MGTIGLACAGKAARVLGIEVNRSAVQCAVQNARLNGIQNARFVCADAGKAMLELAGAGERPDVVILDPPRAGSTPEFLTALDALAPAARFTFPASLPPSAAIWNSWSSAAGMSNTSSRWICSRTPNMWKASYK